MASAKRQILRMKRFILRRKPLRKRREKLFTIDPVLLAYCQVRESDLADLLSAVQITVADLEDRLSASSRIYNAISSNDANATNKAFL